MVGYRTKPKQEEKRKKTKGGGEGGQYQIAWSR